MARSRIRHDPRALTLSRCLPSELNPRPLTPAGSSGRPELLAAGHVPKTYIAVLAGRGQVPAVGAERPARSTPCRQSGSSRSCSPVHGSQRFTCGHRPPWRRYRPSGLNARPWTNRPSAPDGGKDQLPRLCVPDFTTPPDSPEARSPAVGAVRHPVDNVCAWDRSRDSRRTADA